MMGKRPDNLAAVATITEMMMLSQRHTSTWKKKKKKNRTVIIIFSARYGGATPKRQEVIANHASRTTLIRTVVGKDFWQHHCRQRTARPGVLRQKHSLKKTPHTPECFSLLCGKDSSLFFFFCCWHNAEMTDSLYQARLTPVTQKTFPICAENTPQLLLRILFVSLLNV